MSTTTSPKVREVMLHLRLLEVDEGEHAAKIHSLTDKGEEIADMLLSILDKI